MRKGSSTVAVEQILSLDHVAYYFSVELLEVLWSTYILGPVTQRGAVNTITQMTTRSQGELRNGLWVLGN